jgi:phosphoribosylaminoimidazole carboxylase (NCAIR synthetase)
MKIGRKIGHITVLGKDMQDLTQNLMIAKQIHPITLE